MARGIRARRQRIEAWRLISSLLQFTADDLAAGVEGLTRTAARSLIRRLLEEGAIEHVESRRIGAEGSCEVYRRSQYSRRIPKAIDQRYYWQHQVWEAIKVHRHFSVQDLLPSIEPGIASYRQVARYCRALEAEGYLARVGGIVPGQSAEYQLTRQVAAAPHVRTTRALQEEI